MANVRKTAPVRKASGRVRSNRAVGGDRRDEGMHPVTRPMSAQARRQMIAEAAYFCAERRQFAPGFEVEDWLAAERAIDALLASPPNLQ